eukprot:2479692-Alexandrium_andersonii.AAC.1
MCIRDRLWAVCFIWLGRQTGRELRWSVAATAAGGASPGRAVGARGCWRPVLRRSAAGSCCGSARGWGDTGAEQTSRCRGP